MGRFSEDREFCERYEISCNEIEEEDGIKEGAHVRYIGISEKLLEFAHYCGRPSDPRGKLDFDTIYEIECRTIARSYSLVKLVGFGKYDFSPSIFKAINKNEEKKFLKAGGRVRYVGTEYNVLNFDTVYEVENVGKHYFGIGYEDIKLVGFEERFERKEFEKVVN